MAALTGNKIKDSYLGLLKSIDNVAFAPRAAGTFVQISDGGGNGLPLYMSVNAIRFHNAYTFPSSDGTGGQVLSTDGAGNLSFSESSDNQTLQEVLTQGNTTDLEITTSAQFNGDINGALLQKVKAAEALSKGDVVYISGGTGTNPEVSKAKADSSTTMPSLGIMKEPLSLDAEGECITSGELTGLGTLLGSFSTGDDLYISATTAGALVNTAPTGVTNLIQKIGKVIKGGSGGALTVLGAFRVNALPNLPTGVIVGNGTSAVSASSNLLIASDGTITLYQPNNVPTDLSNYNIGGGNIALNTGGFNTGFGEDNLSQVGFTGDDNSAFGYKASFSMTTGRENTSFGSSALYTETTGRGNIAIGYHSMYNALNVYYSTVIGYESLYSNTTGTQNVALGYQSLYTNLVGDGNTALGYKSLQINTGDKNIAIGYSSGNLITSGTNNVILGSFSGYIAATIDDPAYDITTTSNNVVISDGAGTLYQSFNDDGLLRLHKYGNSIHTGTLVKALGVDSSGNVIEFTADTGTVTSVGLSVPTGLTVTGSPITTSGTIAIANTSGYSIPTDAKQTQWDTAYTNRITTATSPLSIATNTISLGTIGVANGGTGATTLTGILLGNGTSAISSITSASDGYVLTADGIGGYAFEVASGGDVTADGASVASRVAVWNNTTGELRGTSAIATVNSNIYLFQPSTNGTDKFNYIIGGAFAINENDFGIQNTGFGYRVLNSSDFTGNNNTAFGTESQTVLTTGLYNTSIGSFAMYDNRSGSYNVGLGGKTMFNQRISNYNVAIGYDSMDGDSVSQSNASNYNTAVGHESLQSIQGGDNNTVVGYNSGNAITTGSNNVIIGSNTGSTITTSSNNIIISDGSGNIRQSFDINGDATFNGGATFSGSVDIYKTTDSQLQIKSLNEDATLIINSGADGVGGANREEGFIKFYQDNADFFTLGKRNNGQFVLTDHTASQDVITFQDGGGILIQPANNLTTFSGVVNIPVGAEATPSLIFAGDSDSGMWHPAANTLAFSTFGNERLRISSGGDTTITTTTNQGGLTITSATDNTTLRLINTATSGKDWRLYSTGGSSGLGVGKLFIKVGTTETAARLVSFVDDGSDIKMGIGSGTNTLVYPLEVYGGNGDGILFKDTTNSVTNWLGGFGGAAVVGALTNSDLALYAGASEKMRISTGGDVKIGTGGSSANGLTIRKGGNHLFLQNQSNTTTYWNFDIDTNNRLYIITQATAQGVFINDGDTAFTGYSDENLKENIKPLKNVLNKILDYKCVEYNFKSDKSKDKKIGFIAQDWDNDYPQITSKGKDDYLGMKYTETIPVLLKAIQEQQTIIEDLKSRIETLEG